MQDLLIIGAGPAGCAAAIQACRAGLEVTIIEARESARAVPGETLHPGIEPLFARLGILNAVEKENFPRHYGVWISWDGPRRFEPYGSDAKGTWRGYQAERRRLHTILLDAARRAGARLELGLRAEELIAGSSQVEGVVAGGREFRAQWTADATGRQAFIARALDLTKRIASPHLRAQFGWRQDEVPELQGQPEIFASPGGWQWRAPLGRDQGAWVSLEARNDAKDAGNCAGVDVSWRHFSAVAGPGYFLLGDAGTTLDPAASHGVLRAIMSGMLCGHLSSQNRRQRISEKDVIACYRDWLDQQFEHDSRELRRLYLCHPDPEVARLFATTGKENAELQI